MPFARDRHEVQTHESGDSPNAYPAGMVELIDTIRNWTRRTGVATNWKADTIFLTANQGLTLLNENKQRCRALIFTDASNTVPVWISSSQINADPTGANRSNAIPLAAGSAQLELSHAGAVHARATAATVVYVISEYLA